MWTHNLTFQYKNNLDTVFTEFKKHKHSQMIFSVCAMDSLIIPKAIQLYHIKLYHN